jgi:hypothetical protein
MATAAIKAINARIRSNPWSDYFFSTRECLATWEFRTPDDGELIG